MIICCLLVISVVLKALAYDERHGAHSVGELLPQSNILLLVGNIP